MNHWNRFNSVPKYIVVEGAYLIDPPSLRTQNTSEVSGYKVKRSHIRFEVENLQKFNKTIEQG
jgi:hypothetical protein